MRQLTKVLGTVGFLLLSSAGAYAAPQILDAVATAQPQKLHCVNGQCQVQIATLCLEQKRKDPIEGHVYTPMDASVFTVVALNRAGKTVEVPLPNAVFRAARGFTATAVMFPTSGLQARGLKPLALTVSAGTILVPAPVPGDAHPDTQAELARVTNVYWPQAEHLLKTQPQKVGAIGMLNRLLNATPVAGMMPATARRDFWRGTFGMRPQGAPGSATALAADALATCQGYIEKGFFFTLRQCLETRVDKVLIGVNVEYWQAAKHAGT